MRITLRRNYRQRKRKKKRSAAQTALRLLLAVAAVLLLAGLAIVGYSQYGRLRLQKRAQSEGPQLASEAASETTTGEAQLPWKESYVRYDGEIYDYNSDILTFLFMGIDKQDTVVQQSESGVDGGQADALFLLVLNPRTKEMSVIGLNRNTMTDIDVYDENGGFIATTKAQLAVQHGFGDGREESCRLQEKAVRRLMYDLPIHGYCAINMSAVPTINDAVGGVDVTVLEDLTRYDSSLQEGAQVHLEGQQAYLYVRSRETDEFASADSRLRRQKQYLQAFLQKAASQARSDVTSVARLYRAIEPSMVTDITADEALYLAGTAAGYRFGKDNFYMLPGETTMGENGYEEFHVDEDALYRLILGVFYEKVNTAAQERPETAQSTE